MVPKTETKNSSTQVQLSEPINLVRIPHRSNFIIEDNVSLSLSPGTPQPPAKPQEGWGFHEPFTNSLIKS